MAVDRVDAENDWNLESSFQRLRLKFVVKVRPCGRRIVLVRRIRAAAAKHGAKPVLADVVYVGKGAGINLLHVADLRCQRHLLENLVSLVSRGYRIVAGQ